MELTELVKNYAALRAKRQEREAVIKKMKELEDQMAGMIMNQMAVSGMKTINFDGVGRVETSSRDHAEIRDREKLARFVIGQAITAAKNGAPMADALSILQQRAALGTITDLIAQGFNAEDMGVEVKEKATIKFTKA